MNDTLGEVKEVIGRRCAQLRAELSEDPDGGYGHAYRGSKQELAGLEWVVELLDGIRAPESAVTQSATPVGGKPKSPSSTES